MKMSDIFKFALPYFMATIFIITTMLISPSHSDELTDNDIDRELILTKEEKMAFDKFKDAVLRMNRTEDYMKQEIFLLRWIRAKKLNVNKAIDDVYRFIQFAEKNRLDTILNEDWSDISSEHPFHTDAIDRQGRPVGYGSVGASWNVRRTILQGKRERLARYQLKIVYDLFMKVTEASKMSPNVTQFVGIFNLHGFSTEQICPMCMATYIRLLEVYNSFFPGYTKDIIIINAPQSFSLLMQTLTPVLSSDYKESLHLFDTNKRKWKPYQDSRIDPTYLPYEFGGTKHE